MHIAPKFDLTVTLAGRPRASLLSPQRHPTHGRAAMSGPRIYCVLGTYAAPSLLTQR